MKKAAMLLASNITRVRPLALRPNPSIVATGLTYTYPGSSTPAIDNVDLSIDQGEFVAVIGRSGCGKSTLLRCLSGLIPQASQGEMQGKVEVCNLDTRTHPLHRLATVVNMVFQDPDVGFFCSTVEDEIAFGPRNLGLDDVEVERRVEFALESTCMEDLRARHAVDLSGGEKRKLAIASVLSMMPKVIVLDEPTSDLDAQGADSVLQVLESLRTRHEMTIVVAEHRLDNLSTYLNRVFVMDQGRIVAQGTPSNVFNMERLLLSGLGIRHPLYTSQKSRGRVTQSGTEKRTEPECPMIPPETLKSLGSGGMLLRVDSLSFSYPHGPEVLRDISFEIQRGEVVALLGANGSGKTTLALLLAGLLKPSQGRIVLNNMQGRRTNGNPAKRVGLLFQNPSRQLFCDSVREEIEFGPRNMGCVDFSRAAQGMMRSFGLTGYADTHPHHLSEGEKQRLATASILATSPDLLILDEPTTGQDWGNLKALMDLLQSYVAEGMSVLLITHDAHLVQEFASRDMTLVDGRIAADGPVDLIPRGRVHEAELRPLPRMVYNK